MLPAAGRQEYSVRHHPPAVAGTVRSQELVSIHCVLLEDETQAFSNVVSEDVGILALLLSRVHPALDGELVAQLLLKQARVDPAAAIKRRALALPPINKRHLAPSGAGTLGYRRIRKTSFERKFQHQLQLRLLLARMTPKAGCQRGKDGQ